MCTLTWEIFREIIIKYTMNWFHEIFSSESKIFFYPHCGLYIPKKNRSAIVIVLFDSPDAVRRICPQWKVPCKTKLFQPKGTLTWDSNSFLKNPMSPPNPANSWANLNNEPSEGKTELSRRSTVRMCLREDFNVWPHCSRTGKKVQKYTN